MPRFVVLEHDSPRGLHWDFMLEHGEVLVTWALPSPPGSAAEVTAESLPDHRPLYLDYEGPVSGGRGTVVRWDKGTYEIRHHTESEWAVYLIGNRLRGEVHLRQLPNDLKAWQFTFTPA